jgi:dienelactone hydrolase
MVRRGSGGSDGTYWEDVVPPETAPDHWRATLAQLEVESSDVSSAIAWLRAQPFVDAARVSVAGCSFGGIHTLLAAERPQGLRAAVDFAGGAISWSSSPELQERLARAARGATVPVFFVQAKNDFDTSPTQLLPLEMAAVKKAYRAKIFPPHGKTHEQGHAHFCNHGMREWGPDVLDFLEGPG